LYNTYDNFGNSQLMRGETDLIINQNQNMKCVISKLINILQRNNLINRQEVEEIELIMNNKNVNNNYIDIDKNENI